MRHVRTVRMIVSLTALGAVGLSCGDVGTVPIVGNLDQNGGTFSDPAGLFTFVFPAGAVSRAVRLTVASVASPPADTRLLGGTAVEVTMDPVVPLAVPVTVTINYASLGASPDLPGATLRIGKVGPAGWFRLASTNNTSQQTITASLDTLSTFGLLGQRLSALVAVSTPDSLGVAGGTASPAPVVRLTDTEGEPVSGVAVAFAITAGGGAVAPASATTNAQGDATVTLWSFGPQTGANALTASVVGSALSAVTFSSNTGNVGPAGGTFVDPSGIYTFVFPAGAVSRPVTVTLAAAAGAPADTRLLAGTGVDVTMNPSLPLAVPVSASVNYGGLVVPADLPGNTLRLGEVGPSGWVRLTSVNNTVPQTVTGTLDSLGTFGLLGQRLNALAAISTPNPTGVPFGTASPVPSVRLTDTEGAPVAGVPVAYAVTGGGGSMAPSTVTTNAQGDAAATSWTFGAAAGANTATGSVGGTGLTPVTFTVTTSGGGGGNPSYPNEPTGFVVVREDSLQGPVWGGNGAWRDGWIVENLVDPTYNVTMQLTADGSATISPPTTLEFAFDTSSRSGGGPRLTYQMAGADHVYISFHFLLSGQFTPNWGPGILKLLVVEPNNVIMSTAWWNVDNNGGGPRSTIVDLWSRLNSGGHDYLNTFQPAGIGTWTTVTNGTWHQMELRLQRGAAAGQGTAAWWLDGVLQGQHTGLTFGNASNGSPFTTIELTPQQGGSGSPAPNAMFVRFDHIRISRQP